MHRNLHLRKMLNTCEDVLRRYSQIDAYIKKIYALDMRLICAFAMNDRFCDALFCEQPYH